MWLRWGVWRMGAFGYLCFVVACSGALMMRVLAGEAVARPPVWAMRQAGRVLKRYRALRARVGSFKDMVKDPSLVAEITCMPLEDLGVDAAIIFSDILVIPEAMGFPYLMEEGRGPYFEHFIRRQSDVEALQEVRVEKDLGYVMEGLRLSRLALPKEVPLIGFSGAPWTLLAYLLEGGGSKTYGRARGFLYTYPRLAHQALEKITEAVISYLRAQRVHGADILQLFEPLAEVLPVCLYKEFGLRYVKRICEAMASLPPEAGAPLFVFVKGGRPMLDELAALPCAGLSIDWMTPLAEAVAVLKKTGKVLQGNFDPAFLYASKDHIEQEVIRVLKETEGIPYVANLGHGLYPDIAEDRVRHWVKVVQGYRSTGS